MEPYALGRTEEECIRNYGQTLMDDEGYTIELASALTRKDINRGYIVIMRVALRVAIDDDGEPNGEPQRSWLGAP